MNNNEELQIMIIQAMKEVDNFLDKLLEDNAALKSGNDYCAFRANLALNLLCNTVTRFTDGVSKKELEDTLIQSIKAWFKSTG